MAQQRFQNITEFPPECSITKQSPSYSNINNHQKPAESLCSANKTLEVIKMYNVSLTTLLRNIPKPFLPFICFAVFFSL
jgi:hypothetical protein